MALGTVAGTALLFLQGFHGAASHVGEGTALPAVLPPRLPAPSSLNPAVQLGPLLPGACLGLGG